jgi:cell wall-associated NlpC family hydrolase
MSRAVKVLSAMAMLPCLALLTVAAGLQQAVPVELTATQIAASDIPADYLPLYQHAAAAVCPGLSWTALAGVGKVESDHGRSPGPSPAGAVGPMQFLPSTWASYGVDDNSDGQADPLDPADAIPAAAGYLCALGAADHLHDALIAYNCGNTGPHCQSVSAGYAATVLATAARYGRPPAGAAGPVAALAIDTALAQVGTPYLWGGTGPGGFDCSGLTRFAYASAGTVLPRTARDQLAAGPAVPGADDAQAGDLLFFTSRPDRVADHVGIYLADGRMVDAPHTGALVRVEHVDLASPRLVGITRPAST